MVLRCLVHLRCLVKGSTCRGNHKVVSILLREAKISDLGYPALKFSRVSDENVVLLDVAVCVMLSVDECQSRTNITENRQNLGLFESSMGQVAVHPVHEEPRRLMVLDARDQL